MSFKPRVYSARYFCAIALILGTGSIGFAQGTASMTGRVEDPSEAAVPSTNVTVTSVETGATRTVTSDEAGNYQILSLPVGRYDVKAEKAGFKAAVQTGINLVVGQQAVVNLKLEVGSVGEQVTVTADAALVNTTTSSVAGLVGEQQVKDLPLNGRSFDLLITLNPSVVNYTSMKGAGSVAGGNIFSVAGRRPNENLTLLNGVDYPGASNQSSTPGGASGLMLGVDAVREYNMLTNDYGAEYGKKAGAQVNVVTQSGTNQLHGSLFEFLRNSDLDARNFFEIPSIGPFKRNNFGGALGGPIKKNKTFIFGNYEGLRQRLAIPTVTFAPDANARLGLLPCGTGGPTCAAGTVTGTPTKVAGLDPRILPYLALWPVPTIEQGGGVGEAISDPSQAIHQDFGTVRLDQTFSGKDTLSGVYTIDDGINTNPAADPLFGTVTAIRTQILSLTQTHIFSPTVINTFTAGYSRAFFHSLNSTIGPGLDSLAFITGKSAGAISIGSQNVSTSTGLTAVGSANPDILFRRNLFTYTDGVQMIRGKHQLSFGAWLQRTQSNDNDPSGSLGQATFTSLTTMLQGTVSAFKVAPDGTELGWRAWLGAWYAQDSIQLRPNLTMRVGLRHEFSTDWNEVNGRAGQEVFIGGVIQTNPTVGSTFNTQNNSKWLLEPRVSLAWDPFGKGKTSIRAGFSTQHDMVDELFYLVDSAQPFNAAASFSNVSLFSIIPISSTTAFPPTCGPGVTGACSTYSPHGLESNYKIPTDESWTFTFQQQLTQDMSLTVGYLGFQGYHAQIQIDPDQIPAQICSNPAGCLAGGVSTSAATRSTVPQGAEYIPVGSRPNPFLASGIFNLTAGNSNYNALQVDFVKRLTKGLQFRANYTWSKSMDMGTALTNPTGANSEGGVMDITNFKRDWSPSNLDVKYQVSGNLTYELPFGRGKTFLSGARGATDKLVGGWQINSIVTMLTGFPITALIGSNQSGTGNSSTPDRASYLPGYTGDFTSGVSAGCGGTSGVPVGQQLGTANRWFDPCAFVLPAFGTFGNTGRNILRGPGLVDWDMSVFKNTHITERIGLQFRAEFFNILNHTNLGFPADTVGTLSTSGVITRTATTSRQIQFGLKLVF